MYQKWTSKKCGCRYVIWNWFHSFYIRSNASDENIFIFTFTWSRRGDAMHLPLCLYCTFTFISGLTQNLLHTNFASFCATWKICNLICWYFPPFQGYTPSHKMWQDVFFTACFTNSCISTSREMFPFLLGYRNIQSSQAK